MSTILQEDAITEWLVGYLAADAALMALCDGEVTPEVTWDANAAPFVRVDRLEADDLMVIGLFRVWTDCLYHVRGCDHMPAAAQVPDRTTVNAIGARIDALLHEMIIPSDDAAANALLVSLGGSTSSGGFSIHSFREEGEPNPAQTERDGSVWLQSGGIYRIRAA